VHSEFCNETQLLCYPGYIFLLLSNEYLVQIQKVDFLLDCLLFIKKDNETYSYLAACGLQSEKLDGSAQAGLMIVKNAVAGFFQGASRFDGAFG